MSQGGLMLLISYTIDAKIFLHCQKDLVPGEFWTDEKVPLKLVMGEKWPWTFCLMPEEWRAIYFTEEVFQRFFFPLSSFLCESSNCTPLFIPLLGIDDSHIYFCNYDLPSSSTLISLCYQSCPLGCSLGNSNTTLFPSKSASIYLLYVISWVIIHSVTHPGVPFVSSVSSIFRLIT